VAGVDLRQP